MENRMSFEDFWEAYPRKVGKLAAKKAYAKALKVATHEEIVAGIGPYIEAKPDWQDFCHPTTWLSQGRWMDEHEIKPRELEWYERMANTDKVRKDLAKRLDS